MVQRVLPANASTAEVVQVQKSNGQKPLQIGLLINGERHPPGLDEIDDFGGHVNACQVHISAEFLDRSIGTFAGIGADAKHRVDLWISLQCGDGTGFDLRKVISKYPSQRSIIGLLYAS